MKKTALSMMLILLLLGSQMAISDQVLPAASSSSPVGTAITYQGLLQTGDGPVDDNCDFEFSLWDAAIGGAPVGAPQPAVNLPVVNGLFAVQLDFGSEAFTGEARWLETAVRCPAGSGDYTTMTPRQALNPVPYAMFSQDLRLPFSNWTDSALPGFEVENRGEGPAGRFSINNPESESHALKAHSNGSMAAFGAFASNEANAINAVVNGTGSALHLSIDNPGSNGSLINASTNGLGGGAFININNPESGHSALRASTNGTGSAGSFNSTGSGTTLSAHSTGSGNAFWGRVEGTGDLAFLQIDNPENTGSLINASTNGLGMGASIRIDNPENDYAALQASTNGSGKAIYGSAHGSATAVSGWSFGSGQAATFQSEGTGGALWLGIRNPENTGSVIDASTNGLGSGASIRIHNPENGHSAFHASTDGSGRAATFQNVGSGDGVGISSPPGTVGLSVVGGSKNAVIATSEGARLLYEEESSAAWFTDYGFGRLSGDSVFIAIDHLFAETVNLEEPYHVFLQAYGDAELYVSQRTVEGFEVRLRAGDPDVEFSYRLVATRRGYEGKRLERAPWADDDPNLYPASQEGDSR